MTGGHFKITCEIAKRSDELGIVYGFAIVCEKSGQPYTDGQLDRVPPADMVQKALDFALVRKSGEMHERLDGSVPFLFPLTREIADGLGIQTDKTGLLVGVKPSPAVYAKVKDGTYKHFSIGGERFDLDSAFEWHDVPGGTANG